MNPRWPSRRARPDFLVIGAQKSGTTSLFRRLADHPDLAPPREKELQFFSRRHARGPAFYARRFPTRRAAAHRRTFDNTPSYLFDPRAPHRAHALLPDARLVALLREPASRAHSHYQHQKRRGREPLAFAAALDAEPDRLAPHLRRIAEGREPGPAYYRASYASRGLYAEQLDRWLQLYPRERLLVLAAEDLWADPHAAFARLAHFLDLDPAPLAGDYPRANPGGDYSPMPDDARARLTDFFAQPNRQLARLLGDDAPRWCAQHEPHAAEHAP